MRYDILCIFTHSGKTYTFRDVVVDCNNETMLVFKYSAMSDGRLKTANFPKQNICGWSTTPRGVDKTPGQRERKEVPEQSQ